MNFAVTCVSARSVIAHPVVPVQGPTVQPSKTKPGAGVALRVTTAPSVKSELQVVESQSRPGGVEMTLPEPSEMTVRWWNPGGGGSRLKLAVTAVSPFIGN